MAENGYKVEQNPDPKPNGRRPDYKIEGEYADALSPRTEKVGTVYSSIHDKVARGQADIIVVNLQDTPKMNISDLEKMLKDYPILGLKQVFFLRDERILRSITFYSNGRKT